VSHSPKRLSAACAAGAVLCGAVLAGAPVLRAQASPVSESPTEERLPRRLSFGVRWSILARQLIKGGTVVTATSSPALRNELTSASTAGRYGGGFTAQYALSRRVAVSADLLWRNVSYKAGAELVKGVDDPDTSDDERRITTTSETTRIRYWDVPILARFYARGEAGLFRRFFDVGVTIRRVGRVRTATEITDVDDETCCDETPAYLAHSTVMGIVVGAGIQAVDEFGIKVMPQVRYTRWLGDTLAAGPTRSKRDQLEVLLGFTF
jgi:hypothetical protein